MIAYEEIAGMLKAVEKHRDNKPYLLKGNSFSLYFFTNENGGRNAEYPFPNDVQAYTSTNGYYGNMKTEMLLNADKNPYDFRPTLQHELVHYYDQNAKTNDGYSSYWGVGGAFFSREGAAEYGCYNYYQYPKNTKNDLPLTWPKDKKSILEYAKQQGGYRTPLLSQTDFRSFGDIYNASNNNYGMTYSLYWYLVQEYGEAKIQEYITYVNNKYEPNQSIPQEEKDSVAMKFLGKKEEQVLKEWLTYFNNFK
ncbi:hypothetical protein [Brevibacillus sp. H7]|uniref:hypothetical protein n=1 Tax=Brevibacillus sp. H7 TaxID=3349138 RepID=UPI0037FFC3CC